MSDAKLGARNDDSSLFSLDALKKKEAELSAQPNKQGEDSGMIDIKALASLQKPDGSGAAVPALSTQSDLFQIQAPIAPLAPLAQSLLTSPVDERMVPGGAGEVAAPKSKTPMIVAGVAVVVALGAVAFAFTRSPEAPKAPASAVAVATAAPTATAPPAPEEPRIAAVTPGQRAVKEDVAPKPTVSATAAVAPPVQRPPGGGGGPRPQAPPKPPKEEAPKAPAAPACDLACQMQRAVNGKK
jgi:hypothetical protein